MVKPGGRIEVVVGGLAAGERVEVIVRKNGPGGAPARAGFGADRGLIEVRDDFDAPLAELDEHV